MKLYFQISNNFIFLSKQNLDMLDVLNRIILKKKKEEVPLISETKIFNTSIYMKRHRLLKNKERHVKGNVTVSGLLELCIFSPASYALSQIMHESCELSNIAKFYNDCFLTNLANQVSQSKQVSKSTK